MSVTVIHSEVTPDEKEKQMERIKEAIRRLWIAKERSERNATSDNL